MTKEELKKEAREWSFRKKYAYGYAYTFEQVINAYIEGAEPREKCIADLETQLDQLQRINNEQKETLKKVRVALIQERAANIMNYGKGGVEMFDSLFKILKGVSN